MKHRIHFGMVSELTAGSINNSRILKKIFLIMKLVAIILFIVTLQVSASSYGQNVSMTKTEVSLKDAFKELRLQTGYYFIYKNEVVANIGPVNISVKNVSLEKALTELLKGLPLTYTIEEKIIVIKPKALAVPSSVQQNRILTGSVVDAEDGLPLPGVSVRIKGGVGVAVTGTDGNFKLTIKASDKILVFTYLGYTAKEIPITASNTYNVKLEVQSTQLQEVAIAFGTTTKRELTNSVSQVLAKDIEQRPISNLTSALVGAAPGVQTNAGSGQPGEGPDVRIRGFGSVTNDNNPLYVLDGAPYEGVLNSINPDDIESISILKDAASTALYGARAANGIVLITTKKGKKNSNTITAKLTQAMSSRGLPVYETVDAYDYFPLMWESIKNGTSGSAAQATLDLKSVLGWNPFNVADDEIVLADGKLNPNAKLLYKDDMRFSDYMKQTGLRSDMALSLSGGSDKSDYYVSLGYLRENGYVIASDFKRYTGRIRVNAQPRPWLSAGLTLTGNYSASMQANESSGINENPFYVDTYLAPIYPVHLHNPITGEYILDANGNKQFDAGDYRPLFTGRNIAAETELNDNSLRRNAIIVNTNLAATFLKDFKFSTTFSANLGNYRSSVIDNAIIGDAKGTGRISRVNSMTAYLNWNQLLNYSKSFGKHNLKALLGHESYINYYDYLTGSRRNQAVDNEGSGVLDNYTTVTGLGSYDRYYKTEGYLSKFDYNYDSKYLASFSARRDGSSRFLSGNRRGNFWALSGAWNIDKEDFFKLKWVDFLKLRSSYGEVGNDRIGIYFSDALYTLAYNNGSEPGAIKTTVESDVKWETNINTDVALEFSLFKNRINASVEYYRRQSKNLLFDIALPLTAPATSVNANFGSMRNEGIEVTLGGDVIRKKSFTWITTINMSTLKNKIITLPEEYKGRANGTKRYEEGKSLYEFYMNDWAAINPTTGADLWHAESVAAIPTASRYVLNGDTLSTSSTYARDYFAGRSIPDLYGSINNTFTYKNFSLQVMAIYQIGGYTYDNDYISLMSRGTAGRALHVDALDRWQNEGDITYVPKRITGATTVANNDRFLTSATYINFRNATLTYNIPKKAMQRFGIGNARVYASGENIFISSKRKGMDPTQTYTGSPSYTYAPARIISLGLNVTL